MKRIDKVLLVIAPAFALFILGFWLFLKRSNRDYYIPKDFQGWVNVQYGIKEAEPLEQKNGVYQLSIPASGYLETSTELEEGWGRDSYFWQEAGKTNEIPKIVDLPDSKDKGKYVFSHQQFHYSHQSLLESLQVGADTLLWDDTRIQKIDAAKINYETGNKTIESFYVSQEPQLLWFEPPQNPNTNILDLKSGNWERPE